MPVSDLTPLENTEVPVSAPGKEGFRKKQLVPLMLLVVLITLFHWPVLSGAFTFVDNSPDITWMEIPDMELRAKALRHGIFPIWDPYAVAGRPMLAQMNPHLLDPFSTLFLLLPLKHGHLILNFSTHTLLCCDVLRAWQRISFLGSWGSYPSLVSLAAFSTRLAA
ncbi:MAG TPA: hypothetical protein VHZ07_27985 [Bryobacteraceae bacterium]|jgi:hypothetical protein|nr:hypothetical protein [Bryobacteraceae bacterium]